MTLRSTAFGLCLASVFAVASPAFADTDTEKAEDAPTCVRQSQVNGFNVIDRKHLVLHSGASREWLVTLKNRCQGLRHEHKIAVKGTGIGCLDKFDQIIVNDNGFVTQCRIDTIEYVEDAKAAKALVEQRLAAEEAKEKAES